MAQRQKHTLTSGLSHLGLVRGKLVVAGVVLLLFIAAVCGVIFVGGSSVFGSSFILERSENSADEQEDQSGEEGISGSNDADSSDPDTEEPSDSEASDIGGLPENEAAASADSQTNTGKDTESSESAHILVHVDGAVADPGVYELLEGSRVNDAVAAAGGLTDEADTTLVNLAAYVEDGYKIYIPKVGEETEVAVVSGADQYGEAGTTTSSTSPSSTSSEASLININTATAEELCTLSGIGEATAAKIIADREQNGAFTSIEDLKRVSGIGDKKFEAIKDFICV